MKYMNLALLVPFLMLQNVIQANETSQHQETQHESGHPKKITLGAYDVELKHLIETFLDGTPFGINQNVMNVMMLVRQKLREMILGVQDPVTKTFKGIYLYKNNFYSVRELVVLESSISPEDHAEFYAVLAHVKEDFERFVAPFIAQAEGTKSQMVRLIQDSCTQRKRNDSLLLRWAEEKSGQETSVFNTEINTFHDFAVFGMDLIHFLEDLMHSCPKAWSQFQNMMKERSAKK
jgi:hypothetical protein